MSWKRTAATRSHFVIVAGREGLILRTQRPVLPSIDYIVMTMCPNSIFDLPQNQGPAWKVVLRTQGFERNLARIGAFKHVLDSKANTDPTSDYAPLDVQ